MFTIMLYQARQALLAQLDQAGQARGIDAAQTLMRKTPAKTPAPSAVHELPL
jgi:hypothetical protein